MRSLMFMPELAQLVFEGKKTETRRPTQPMAPTDRLDAFQPDETFYMRERFALKAMYNTQSPNDAVTMHRECERGRKPDVFYKGAGELPSGERWGRWRPAIHMPELLTRARLLVLEHRREALHLIDDEGAQREGFADRDAFMDAWCRVYGRANWLANRTVHVIRFRKLGTGT